MKVDKDRPSTWKRFAAENCTRCRANCCSMPVEVKLADLLRLGIASADEAVNSIKKLAKREGIQVLSVADLDLPPADNQQSLDLEEPKQ